MKTIKLTTSITHPTELITNLMDGKHSDDIERVQLTGMADGSRGLVQYKGMLYSLEVRPLYEKIDDKPEMPTLKNIFFTMNHTQEDECNECEHYRDFAGSFNPLSGDVEPPSIDCECDDADLCPAAARILDQDLDVWANDIEIYHENNPDEPVSNETKEAFDELMGHPISQIDDMVNTLRGKA